MVNITDIFITAGNVLDKKRTSQDFSYKVRSLYYFVIAHDNGIYKIHVNDVYLVKVDIIPTQ